MSLFKVSVVARNTKDESLATAPVEALVDSGSELTWLPRDVLLGIQITPLRKRSFSTATQQRVSRETGYAILSAEGYETVDEVVFAEPGDLTLLGVRTLEGFGVLVDNIAHRFVATGTIVAVSIAVKSASALIDEKIKELGDWRERTLAKVREIIHEADPEIVEEWKWVKATDPGTPVWSHGGIVCTGRRTRTTSR
jgi:predicted aspartyl protease